MNSTQILNFSTSIVDFMTNNDILRRIRFTFDFSDAQMIDLFQLGGLTVTRAEVSNWLKKDDDEFYKSMQDQDFAMFLNGLIAKNRGVQEGKEPIVERSLTNNIIFRKLKIALELTDDGILELFEAAELRISKAELSALFRNPSHKHYRPCKDQFLRNFLIGIQLKYKQMQG